MAWFQTWGGFLTLVAAGLAAYYARLAAIQGSRIGEAQTRCYLSITSVRVKMWDSGIPEICVDVKNSGNSPARKLSANYQIRYGMADEMTPWSERDGHSETYEISAGQPFEVPRFSTAEYFTPKIMEAFNRKDQSLGIAVRVRLAWEDVFEIPDKAESTWQAIVSGFEGAVCVLEERGRLLAILRSEEAAEKHLSDKGGGKA